jgi:hypothetical protein
MTARPIARANFMNRGRASVQQLAGDEVFPSFTD